MDPQGGEAEVSAYQQIVEDNVDGIGGYVGAHGDLRIAGAPLCGIDAHLNAVKDHTAHDDAEIGDRAVMGLRRGAAEADDRAGKCHQQDA